VDILLALGMRRKYSQDMDPGDPEVGSSLLADFPIAPQSTGTVDDDDDPADERDDENEAPVRKLDDDVKATDEFRPDGAHRGGDEDW